MNPLDLWQKMSAAPGGKWAFSKLLCLKAPYFASIQPLFDVLEPGRCQVQIKKRRAVLNHLGTVHAIALCNMAELAGGTMTEVTLPSTLRWIPKGMTVEYLKKAEGDVVAVAVPESPEVWAKNEPGERKVAVSITQRDNNQQVFRAVITMWVSAKKAR